MNRLRYIHTFFGYDSICVSFGRDHGAPYYTPTAASKGRLHDAVWNTVRDGGLELHPSWDGGYFAWTRAATWGPR